MPGSQVYNSLLSLLPSITGVSSLIEMFYLRAADAYLERVYKTSRRCSCVTGGRDCGPDPIYRIAHRVESPTR